MYAVPVEQWCTNTIAGSTLSGQLTCVGRRGEKRKRIGKVLLCKERFERQGAVRDEGGAAVDEAAPSYSSGD